MPGVSTVKLANEKIAEFYSGAFIRISSWGIKLLRIFTGLCCLKNLKFYFVSCMLFPLVRIRYKICLRPGVNLKTGD